jgi:hypothetical protein
MGGAYNIHERDEKAYKILVGRPSCKWDDNINIVLKERGYEGVDWIHLVLSSIQWQVLVSLQETSGSLKGKEFLDKLCDCQLLKKGSLFLGVT